MSMTIAEKEYREGKEITSIMVKHIKEGKSCTIAFCRWRSDSGYGYGEKTEKVILEFKKSGNIDLPYQEYELTAEGDKSAPHFLNEEGLEDAIFDYGAGIIKDFIVT